QPQKAKWKQPSVDPLNALVIVEQTEHEAGDLSFDLGNGNQLGNDEVLEARRHVINFDVRQRDEAPTADHGLVVDGQEQPHIAREMPLITSADLNVKTPAAFLDHESQLLVQR